VGASFLNGDSACLILGDNIFFGTGLADTVRRAAMLQEGAMIFAYAVRDPERYGVVEFDPDGKVISLEEKPKQPKSHYAVPGIYFYDTKVVQYAADMQPSARGELEITDLNDIYLKLGQLNVQVLGRGVAWLDAGTHESLLQSASFVQAVQERQGMMICCPEEVAFEMGFIDAAQLRSLAGRMADNGYASYLKRLADEA
jgi:glucose-1-phosphate thymidylyltransferase